MRTLPSKTLIHNRYLVGQLVGQGGMGAVYKALDQHLNITVALKHTLGGNEQINRSFSREARILASLRHPALPRITDYFTEDGGLFLVMEFVPGRDLGATLRQHKAPFPVEDVLGWADQLLRVLEYLHSRKPPVLHRDIKPQNIKIGAENDLFLLDFGLAKGAPMSGSRATRSSIHGFTPQYAPIEQIRARGTSPRSDLYATGATIYQLLTSTPPPSAIERAEQILARQNDPLILAHQLNPAIPTAVSSVLARALALAADDRPADAAELRAMFADARLGLAPPLPESGVPIPTLVLPATIPGETPLVLPDPPVVTPPPTTDPPRPPEPQHTHLPVVLDTPTPPTDPPAPATALPAELAPTQMQHTRRAPGRGPALVATLLVSALAGLLLWGRLAQPATELSASATPSATRLSTTARGITPTIRISTGLTAVPAQTPSATLPAPSAPLSRPATARSAGPTLAAAPDGPRLPSATATQALPGLAAPEPPTPTAPPAPVPTAEPEPPAPTSPGRDDEPEEPQPRSATPLPAPTVAPGRTEAPEPPPAYPSPAETSAPTTRSSTGPTAAPTDRPTSAPTREATTEPTAVPVSEPTREATTEPTAVPVSEPTREATTEPTAAPVTEPTDEPPPDEPTDEPPPDEPPPDEAPYP